MKCYSKRATAVHTAILILTGISFLYPLIWLILASFKDSNEIISNSVGLPKVWHFENYSIALKKFDFARYFLNSVIYTGGTVLLVLICVTLFAYATARMKFPGVEFLQSLMHMGLAIPGGAIILGTYTLLLEMGLKNTYTGLILVYTAGAIPMAAVILHGFFRSLPFSLEEAAALDGAGVFQTFFRIILPMVLPAVGTVSIITAMNTWNEYMLAFICINSTAKKSLPVGIANFATARGTDWGGMSAALMLACIPTILLYLFYSEQLENTLTAGAANK